MTDRSEERVSVHDSERVAARDYVEVHDYHENNTTNISAPGSTIVVTPPMPPPRRPHRPNMGLCPICGRAIWLNAPSCRHCGFDPAIEHALRRERETTTLGLLGVAWLVTGACIYNVTEWLGLFAEFRIRLSMVGGAVIVLAGFMWWLWNTRPRDD